MILEDFCLEFCLKYMILMNINKLLYVVIIPEEEVLDNSCHISDALGSGHSMDSIPSTFTNGSCSPNSKLKFLIL